MKCKLPPATLLIALVLACSAGAASAATTSASGSWFSAAEQMVMACVSGNVPACIGAGGGAGVVTPDAPGDPSIKNK